MGHGAELSAKISGVELGAMDQGAKHQNVTVTKASTPTLASDLDAKAHGIEACYLSAMGHGAKPRV